MVVHCCLKSFALKLSAECRIFLPELANIARAWLKFSLLQRTLGSFANGGEKGIYIYIPIQNRVHKEIEINIYGHTILLRLLNIAESTFV